MNLQNKQRQICNNCEKATFLIEKRKFCSVSPEDEDMLQQHLEGCAECRIYEQQSKLIDLMARRITSEIFPGKQLNPTFKQQLQKEITQKFDKDPGFN